MPNIVDLFFCDIDGCLHPGGVYKDDEGNPFSEYGQDFKLLEQQDLLESLLVKFPNVKIVLSTNWVGCLGFEKTKSYFSPAIQSKIIGSTFDGTIPFEIWNKSSRGNQILNYVMQNHPSNWLALDDRSDGFEHDLFRDRHVCPNEYIGIKQPEVFTHLKHLFNVNFDHAPTVDNAVPTTKKIMSI